LGDVERVIESDTGRHRALVVKLSHSAFRIDVERRYDAIDAGGFKRGEYWAALSDWTSYADNLERAVELAVENIRCSEAAV
jgi:hypothetical protein